MRPEDYRLLAELICNSADKQTASLSEPSEDMDLDPFRKPSVTKFNGRKDHLTSDPDLSSGLPWEAPSFLNTLQTLYLRSYLSEFQVIGALTFPNGYQISLIDRSWGCVDLGVICEFTSSACGFGIRNGLFVLSQEDLESVSETVVAKIWEIGLPHQDVLVALRSEKEFLRDAVYAWREMPGRSRVAERPLLVSFDFWAKDFAGGWILAPLGGNRIIQPADWWVISGALP